MATKSKLNEFMFLLRGGLGPEDQTPEQFQNHVKKDFAWIGWMKKRGFYL